MRWNNVPDEMEQWSGCHGITFQMTWNKAGTKILIYRKQKGPNTKIIKRDTLDRAQLPGCLKTDGARQVKPSPHNG